MPSASSFPALHAALSDYHLPTKLIAVANLITASPSDSVEYALAKANQLDIDIVPLQDQQSPIHAYVDRRDLADVERSLALDQAPHHAIGVGDLVAAEGSIQDAMEVLATRDWLFTFEHRKVSGIVTRGDLQHPVARMELFAIFTRLEILAGRTIGALWPGDTWVDEPDVPAEAIAAANRWWGKRRQHDEEPLSRADCLSLAHKLKVLECSSHIRASFENLVATTALSPGPSGALPKEVKQLRDNLAHAYDLTDGITGRWETVLSVALLARDLVELLEMSPRESPST